MMGMATRRIRACRLTLQGAAMHTVIGVFEEVPHAQMARQRLQELMPSGRVHLGAGHLSPSGEVVTEGHGGRQQYENRNVLAALGSFWANLVESHVHSHALDLAMQRGRVVVAVQVDHDEQATTVARLMEECHALVVQHGDAPRVGGTIRKPQPWHAADEAGTRTASQGSGAPIGTHSFTGDGVNVGMPERSHAHAPVEHGSASTPPERSRLTDLLGERPEAGRER
jgi:hypothetical protein